MPPGTRTYTFNGAMEYVRQIRALTAFSGLFESQWEAVNVDNAVFRLHSIITPLILLVGMTFVTMRQHFGEPIECLHSRSDISQQLLQHYCWIESTFSIVANDKQTAAGYKIASTEVAYPGVKTFQPEHSERRVYHKYYQWVYFVLMVQAILFYVPKYIWKAKEARRLRKMITELKLRHILEFSEYDRHRLVQDVMDTLLISNDYFKTFFFCECAYFAHLLFQIWFTNIFLGGAFLSFGTEWLSYAHLQYNEAFDPLIRVFPRMTKCTFHKFGPSGSIEQHDALCFLPINIVNEKVYLILWFWFAILLFVTAFFIFYRIMLVICPPLRYRKLRGLAPSTDKRYLRRLTRRVGNWFILQFIANHMRPSHFRDMIEELVKEHFDSEGKPQYQSKMSKAIQNGLNGTSNATPSAPPPSNSKSHKSHKSPSHESSKKSKLVNFSALMPNFPLSPTRGPPSGQSHSTTLSLGSTGLDDVDSGSGGYTNGSDSALPAYNSHSHNAEVVEIDWPE